MSAVFKREFRAYFTTPIGFIVIAAFYFFLGLYFSMIYSYGSPDTAMVIVAMSTVIVFTMPVLTMRLMSEDRRQKVDQALLTAPVSLTSIVLGKFFAALAVFAIGFAPTVIFEIIVASYVSVNVMSYIYALFGKPGNFGNTYACNQYTCALYVQLCKHDKGFMDSNGG